MTEEESIKLQKSINAIKNGINEAISTEENPENN